MCRRCVAIALLAVLFSQPTRAAESDRIAIEQYLGPSVAVQATVNGVPGRFIFDTGEGVTSITPAFAEKIGCRPWGQISGYQMAGRRIDMERCDDINVAIGKHHARRATVGVLDLMSLLPKDAPLLDGSIALDVFEGTAITIDQIGGRIVLETPSTLKKRIAGAIEIPVRPVRDAQGLALTFDAGVRTPKGFAWMELDTGNFGGFIIGKHLAPVLGLDPNATHEQSLELDIGGKLKASSSAEIRDLIMDGNIGQRILHDRLLTLDLKSYRAWLSAPAR